MPNEILNGCALNWNISFTCILLGISERRMDWNVKIGVLEVYGEHLHIPCCRNLECLNCKLLHRTFVHPLLNFYVDLRMFAVLVEWVPMSEAVSDGTLDSILL